MKSTGAAYILWLPCIFCICGLHRFYVGKPISGLIWLFTLGLLGFGQLISTLARFSARVPLRSSIARSALR